MKIFLNYIQVIILEVIIVYIIAIVDYIAFTDCKMFAINKKNLLILLLNFPDLFEKMRFKEYNKVKNGIKNIMDKKNKS